MRYLIVLLLAGCATPDFQADRYEPACARQCLIAHSGCVSKRPAGFTGACDDTAKQCFSTCPAK